MPSNAIVYTKPNKLELLPVVSEPIGRKDIRIRTVVTSITTGVERFLLTGKSVIKRELKFPVISGSECIGEVIEKGDLVRKVEIGEYVFAWKSSKWAKAQSVFGCQAESLLVNQDDFLPLGRDPKETDVLIGLLAYALSAVRKLRIDKTNRVMLLGLGSVGITIAELLHQSGYERVDACEVFVHRGEMASVHDVALEIDDFPSNYTDRYDVIIEASGRLLLIEPALRYLKPNGTYLLCGTYDEMKTDYRLLQEKEPQLIFSSLTPMRDIEDAKTMMDLNQIDMGRFLTHRSPVNQFEAAYDIALNTPDCIKMSLIW